MIGDHRVISAGSRSTPHDKHERSMRDGLQCTPFMLDGTALRPAEFCHRINSNSLGIVVIDELIASHECQGDEQTRQMIKRYRASVTTCRGHRETA